MPPLLSALAILLLNGLPAGAPEEPAADALSPAALAEQIDSAFEQHWKEQGLRPAKQVDDQTFLRRLSLDLLGTIPPREEVRAFQKDSSKDKRAAKVREYLDHPATAGHLAMLWRDLLLSGAQPSRFSAPLLPWLGEAFAAKTSFADVTRELVGGAGRSDENGAVAFLASYRGEVESATAVTARTFLGLQIQCAQCHDHPTDDWTQDDFEGFATFLSRARVSELDPTRNGMGALYRLEDADLGRDRNDRLAQMEALIQRAKATLPDGDDTPRRRRPQRRLDEESREERIEEMMSSLPPQAKERILQARERQEKFDQAVYLDHTEYRENDLIGPREAMAEWMVAEDNPWFARAVVNRVWEQLFGHGLVEPVDDLSGSIDEVLPQMLETLAVQFHRSGTSVHYLLEAFALSEVYQLAGTLEDDPQKQAKLERHFACHPPRPLSSEQVLNALSRATEAGQILSASRRGRRPGSPAGGMTTQDDDITMANPTALRRFRYVFSDDEGGEGNSFEAGIPQALFLMNSRMTNDAISLRASTVLKDILNETDSDKERLHQMFLATLSRSPSSRESASLFRAMRGSGRGKAEGMTDVYWALLNSSEFLTNR